MSMELSDQKSRRDLFDPENPNRTIILSGDVDEDTVYELMELITYINVFDDDCALEDENYERQPIKMIVNTMGGNVYDGFALIGVMETSVTPIHTYCFGAAMSMGLLIFVAGAFRYAHRLCTFMYHECLDQAESEKLSTQRENMEESDRVMHVYDDYLLERTKLRRKQLDDKKKMKQDWYITANQALRLCIADEII